MLVAGSQPGIFGESLIVNVIDTTEAAGCAVAGMQKLIVAFTLLILSVKLYIYFLACHIYRF